MCGIIGAVSNRDAVPVLLDGLRKLEYRGYDSAGIAAINAEGKFERTRCSGRVETLAEMIGNGSPLSGTTAVGHTRWATHGAPSTNNAHPLIANEHVAVVCNGVIENYEQLRDVQQESGIVFESETDTEVVAHELNQMISSGNSFMAAMRKTAEKLHGAYSIAAMCVSDPSTIVVAREGSPLIIGFGNKEIFIASDMIALAEIADSVIVLENGDIAEISSVEHVKIIDRSGYQVERNCEPLKLRTDSISLEGYSHHMQKEIFEQGVAVAETIEYRISADRLLEKQTFSYAAEEIFDRTQCVRILGCGTSYYAGLVARMWFESFGIPCDAEIASEFRYRDHAVPTDALVVAISQSGETADTLAALEEAKRIGFRYSLALTNSPFSSLVRETDLVLQTHAGPEIGVASTKAFTTQLVCLILLGLALARRRGLTPEKESEIVSELRMLPTRIEEALKLNDKIEKIAWEFADKEHALFLGRGVHYPIALEGALKLKEISYIHAEAYPAGELKHGPLALIDAKVPTIAVAPNNHLLSKLKANIQEVRTRKGRLIVLADTGAPIDGDDYIEIVNMSPSGEYSSPIIYTIALQLLAYHVAIIKGTDIDRPRNLAKSVTVE